MFKNNNSHLQKKEKKNNHLINKNLYKILNFKFLKVK